MYKMKGSIAVLIGAASFGVLSTFVKKAYQQGFSLAEVTGIQAGLGLLFLWFVWLILRLLPQTSKHHSKRLTSPYTIILSGISTGAVSMLYYKSIELVPASLDRKSTRLNSSH